MHVRMGFRSKEDPALLEGELVIIASVILAMAILAGSVVIAGSIDRNSQLHATLYWERRNQDERESHQADEA